MSDADKTSPEAAPRKERIAPSIDLPKADVKDVTPEPVVAKTMDEPVRASLSAGEQAPAPNPSPVRGGSTWPVVGGAVAGAIFGLLGTTIHQNYQAPAVTVADPRVAQVEAAIAAVDKKAADAGQIEQRLTAQIKALEARAVAADQRAFAAEQRAAAAEQKGTTLLQPLESRLKAAEERIASAAEQAGGFERRIDLLGKIEPPKVDLGPLAGRLDALEKSIGSTSARVTLGGEAAEALAGKIKQAEQAIRELGTRKPAETTAAILATTGMARRALESGEPLAAHIAALSSQGVSESLVKPLMPFGTQPAPRSLVLADQIADLATKLPKPQAAPTSNGGFLDRVKSGLLSQVEVKATGSVAPDILASVGRTRSRLAAGDLAGAQAELAAFPADVRDTFKPVADALAARLSAVDALRRIEAESLAATARKS